MHCPGVLRRHSRCNSGLVERAAAGAVYELLKCAELTERRRTLEQEIELIDDEVGADGLSVPGLVDARLIGRLVADLPPVNIMAGETTPPAARLAALDLARISHGTGPYRLVRGHP